MRAPPDTPAKVAVVGPARCGKTSFIKRACYGTFSAKYDETSGFELHRATLADPTGITPSVKAVYYDCGSAALEQEGRWDRMLSDAVAAVLVYDITSLESYRRVTGAGFYERVKASLQAGGFMVLLGTKADAEASRAVPVAEAEAFASKHGLFFMEVSNSDGTNVDLTLTILRIRLAHALSKGVVSKHDTETVASARVYDADPLRGTSPLSVPRARVSEAAAASDPFSAIASILQRSGAHGAAAAAVKAGAAGQQQASARGEPAPAYQLTATATLAMGGTSAAPSAPASAAPSPVRGAGVGVPVVSAISMDALRSPEAAVPATRAGASSWAPASTTAPAAASGPATVKSLTAAFNGVATATARAIDVDALDFITGGAASKAMPAAAGRQPAPAPFTLQAPAPAPAPVPAPASPAGAVRSPSPHRPKALKRGTGTGGGATPSLYTGDPTLVIVQKPVASPPPPPPPRETRDAASGYSFGPVQTQFGLVYPPPAGTIPLSVGVETSAAPAPAPAPALPPRAFPEVLPEPEPEPTRPVRPSERNDPSRIIVDLDVAVHGRIVGRLELRRFDTPAQAAADFALTHGLEPKQVERLIKVLEAKRAEVLAAEEAAAVAAAEEASAAAAARTARRKEAATPGKAAPAPAAAPASQPRPTIPRPFSFATDKLAEERGRAVPLEFVFEKETQPVAAPAAAAVASPPKLGATFRPTYSTEAPSSPPRLSAPPSPAPAPEPAPEAPAPAATAAHRGKFLGRLKVEVAPGKVGAIVIHLGDDPKALVAAFAAAHGIVHPAVITQLTSHTERHLREAMAKEEEALAAAKRALDARMAAPVPAAAAPAPATAVPAPAPAPAPAPTVGAPGPVPPMSAAAAAAADIASSTALAAETLRKARNLAAGVKALLEPSSSAPAAEPEVAPARANIPSIASSTISALNSDRPAWHRAVAAANQIDDEDDDDASDAGRRSDEEEDDRSSVSSGTAGSVAAVPREKLTAAQRRLLEATLTPAAALAASRGAPAFASTLPPAAPAFEDATSGARHVVKGSSSSASAGVSSESASAPPPPSAVAAAGAAAAAAVAAAAAALSRGSNEAAPAAPAAEAQERDMLKALQEQQAHQQMLLHQMMMMVSAMAAGMPAPGGYAPVSGRPPLPGMPAVGAFPAVPAPAALPPTSVVDVNGKSKTVAELAASAAAVLGRGRRPSATEGGAASRRGSASGPARGSSASAPKAAAVPAAVSGAARSRAGSRRGSGIPDAAAAAAAAAAAPVAAPAAARPARSRSASIASVASSRRGSVASALPPPSVVAAAAPAPAPLPKPSHPPFNMNVVISEDRKGSILVVPGADVAGLAQEFVATYGLDAGRAAQVEALIHTCIAAQTERYKSGAAPKRSPGATTGAGSSAAAPDLMSRQFR